MRRPRVAASAGPCIGVLVGALWSALVTVGYLGILPATTAHAQSAEPRPPGLPLANVLGAVEAGQLQEAESLLRSHLESGHQAPAVYFLLGQILLQQHRVHEAEPFLRRAVEGRSDRPLWLHRLAISLARQGQCQAALPFLDRSIKIQATPQSVFDRGLCHQAGGHFAAAEDNFQAVVASEPQHARAWFELGQLARNRGEDQQAADFLRRALAADENLLDARYQLALVDLALDRRSVAIDGLRQVLQQLPGHGGATYNLGRALMASKDDAVRQEGRQLLLSFRQLSQQEDLLDNHLQALQLDPTDVDTRLDTGRLLLGLGRLTEAVEQLETARQLAPKRPAVHGLLADAYDFMGRHDEAIAARLAQRQLLATTSTTQ